ncbi:Glycerol-3-phosphate transporter [Fasciola hepatica]|uniref:Sugar phosphate exchanger 3 n=1 Tax=Fasciola hepatica TaxID=6192 RepID=A0A4E0QX50_FASHE|nr:Glycerol-3-phosphate transporter [Fasciola hepatica]
MLRIAPAIGCLNRCLPSWNDKWGRAYVFACTFMVYMCYHISRKPISVVKSVFHQNCSEVAEKNGKTIVPENATFCDWKPFDGENYDSLFGVLDVVFLSSYAISMFFSGHAADKFHLRHFLSLGSVLCGLSTIAFGLGFFFEIHSFTFYVIAQIVGGIFQASGWPAVVACMGNWFGKSSRGLFMGIWSAHTSIGNILGSVIAGAFVDYAWGWSFVVPGLVIAASGVLTFFFLLPYPEEVDVLPPERGVAKEQFDYAVQSSVETVGTSSSVSLSTVSEPDVTNEPYSAACDSDSQPLSGNVTEGGAVSFLTALRVPGVIEYSLSLLFSKMVSYTFLFWLPNYIRDAGGFDPSAAADLSTIFDLGGIFGGIMAGFLADQSLASATVCVVMLIAAIPTLYLYYVYGVVSVAHCVGLLIPLGLLVNGPYALITTAVSADLGTHPTLQSNSRALASVSGIIDGTGSVGAALGPLLCGLLKPYGWFAVFLMLITACAFSALVS